MKTIIEQTKKIRETTIALLDTFSVEQLNTVPPKFSNNLIWNFVHTLATQQILTYQFSGIPTVADTAFIDAYKKGTKPKGSISAEEIATIKKQAFSLLDQFLADYEKGIFQSYTPYTTSMHIILDNIRSASLYNMAHENLHLGYCLAMKRFV